MSKIYRGEMQDNLGNTIYPHTEAGLVFCADGETVQQKIAGTAETLDGITGVSDSTELDDSTKLATSKAVNSLRKNINVSLGGLRFGTDGDGNYGYYGADGSLIPFSSNVFGFMTAAGEAKTIAAKPLVAYGMDMDTTNNKLTSTQAGQYILCVGGHGTSFNNSLKVNGTKVIQGNTTIVQSLNVGDVITGSASHASAWSVVVIAVAKIK